MPAVTVVIPTRNRWAVLPRSLGSALAQRDVELRVIVVDDGSDDAPPSMRELADARVELVSGPHRGVSAARNAGLARCQSEWVAFLDDDDVFAPTRLATMIAAAEAASADFAYSDVLTVDGELRPLFLVPAPAPEGLRDELRRWNAVPGGGSSFVVRMEAARNQGGFDEELSFVADWDLWLRLSERGRGVAVRETLLAYSVHASSWVLSGDPAIEGDLRALASKHPTVAPDRVSFEQWAAFTLVLTGRRPDAARAYLRTARRHRDPSSLARALLAALPLGFRRHLRRWKRVDAPWLASTGVGAASPARRGTGPQQRR